MSTAQKIDAVTKRPGCAPRHVSIAGSLKNLQKIVGGYIETVTFSTAAGTIVVICNEEGRWMGMEHCCTINGTEFVGDIAVVGADLSTGELADLPCSFAELKTLLPGLWEM